MEKVALDDVEPRAPDPDRSHDRRSLTDPLNAANVAVNHYVLAPDERLSGSLHAHAEQEEVFVVLDGAVTFETREDGGDGDGQADDNGTEIRKVTVGANEAVRFAPGEFQTGWNDADEEAVVLALGAPRDGGEVRIARIAGFGGASCPDCGHDWLRISDGGLVCPECGGELEVG